MDIVGASFVVFPHVLGLVQDLRALHPQQQEHGDDGQESADRVRDDVFQRVIVGDEQDM